MICSGNRDVEACCRHTSHPINESCSRMRELWETKDLKVVKHIYSYGVKYLKLSECRLGIIEALLHFIGNSSEILKGHFAIA